MSTPGAGHRTARRSGVVAWALWDCGATGMNAIVVTFVFSVYLTQQVGAGLPGDTTPAELARPGADDGRAVRRAVGARDRDLGRRTAPPPRGADGADRARSVALTASMSLIRADYHYLWPGLVLLACTAACSDLATVPYNAMLRAVVDAAIPPAGSPDSVRQQAISAASCCW